jgi:hypothetical protein
MAQPECHDRFHLPRPAAGLRREARLWAAPGASRLQRAEQVPVSLGRSGHHRGGPVSAQASVLVLLLVDVFGSLISLRSGFGIHLDHAAVGYPADGRRSHPPSGGLTGSAGPCGCHSHPPPLAEDLPSWTSKFRPTRPAVACGCLLHRYRRAGSCRWRGT